MTAPMPRSPMATPGRSSPSSSSPSGSASPGCSGSLAPGHARVSESPGIRPLTAYWLGGWGFDWVYERVFVRPFQWFARVAGNDLVDYVVDGIAWLDVAAWHALSAGQTRAPARLRGRRRVRGRPRPRRRGADGDAMILILYILIPIVAAPLAWLFARRSPALARWTGVAGTAIATGPADRAVDREGERHADRLRRQRVRPVRPRRRVLIAHIQATWIGAARHQLLPGRRRPHGHHAAAHLLARPVRRAVLVARASPSASASSTS